MGKSRFQLISGFSIVEFLMATLIFGGLLLMLADYLRNLKNRENKIVNDQLNSIFSAGGANAMMSFQKVMENDIANALTFEAGQGAGNIQNLRLGGNYFDISDGAIKNYTIDYLYQNAPGTCDEGANCKKMVRELWKDGVLQKSNEILGFTRFEWCVRAGISFPPISPSSCPDFASQGLTLYPYSSSGNARRQFQAIFRHQIVVPGEDNLPFSHYYSTVSLNNYPPQIGDSLDFDIIN